MTSSAVEGRVPGAEIGIDWNCLVDRTLEGRVVTSDEALAMLRAPGDELLPLLHAAFRLRAHYHGRDVRIHVLRNAKSGLCPEDCAFCSQSVSFGSNAPRYQLQSVEELVEGAREAARMQAVKYCMVTSTRGPSQRDLDLRFLLAVCNWALTVREKGQPLLGSNPFRGFPVPAEQNIKQPITPEGEIVAMRTVAAEVHPLCPLYLELTYGTGHRCMAVGLLRWNDIDLDLGTVCWKGPHDKIGFEHIVPLDDVALKLLRAHRRTSPTIGDAWIFPSPADPSRPISRHLVRDWWKRLEKAAGIDHIRGRGWHSLRRRFATDLDHLPLKQLMALGGWKTATSVVRYQKHTTEQLRAGLKTRRRGIRAS